MLVEVTIRALARAIFSRPLRDPHRKFYIIGRHFRRFANSILHGVRFRSLAAARKDWVLSHVRLLPYFSAYAFGAAQLIVQTGYFAFPDQLPY